MALDWRHRLAAAVLCVQLLLVFDTYRSTDFEVHRNWLAITHSLPISKWYYEATSEWTLDYPPLFAWLEWALAHAAALFDPEMLRVDNLGHASPATVLFQRLSVSATGLLLVWAMLSATAGRRREPAGLTAFALVVANAGLIMVDNIHFQYNSVLLGVLVWSILLLQRGHHVAGGLAFAALLCMKHLFAYLAPVYFVYLLKHYVIQDAASSLRRQEMGGGGGYKDDGRGPAGGWAAALGRLALLGGGVLLVVGASFGPFIALGQMGQVLSRLFPFARGLVHAYWAPNAWGLYSFADKVAAAAAARAGLSAAVPAANLAGGVVGVSSYVLLPNVGAGACAALALAALAPCLAALWRAPRAAAAAMLPGAVAYANLCGFVFGYHVHEKAALTVEVPMALAAVADAAWGRHYLLLSSAAHVAIFPLLFEAREVPVRWLLAAAYYVAAAWGLSAVHGGAGGGGGGGQAATADASDSTASASASPAAAAARQRQRPEAAVSSPPVSARTRRRVAAAAAAASGAGAVAASDSSQGGSPHKPARQRPCADTAASPSGGGPCAAAAADAGDGAAAPPTLRECCSWLPLPYRLYLAGLVPLELYCTLGHSALGLAGRLPFVPLMLTSVYCALGVCWTWAWMARWFAARCGGAAGQRPAAACKASSGWPRRGGPGPA